MVALKFDPYSIAFTRKTIEYLTPVVVGHVSLEISWFVYFFLERGGSVEAKVYRTKSEVSPIPKEGLEIITQVTFKIYEDKKKYLEQLISLIKENYVIPELVLDGNKDDEEDQLDLGDLGEQDDLKEDDVIFFIDDE